MKTGNLYGDPNRPCFPELIAITFVGLLHVLLEVGVSEPIARLYNAVASLGFLVYLVWRARKATGVVRAWGMRCDNFWQSLRALLIFGAVGVAALLSYGVASNSLSLPWTFWLTVMLYPLWGIAQQFALQNLIARNLAGFLSHPLAVAGVSSVLFAAAHYPRGSLVLLTFVSGFFFTLIYRRVPNLWAVGTVHGILGSMAVYIVLGEDPGAAIWEFFQIHSGYLRQR